MKKLIDFFSGVLSKPKTIQKKERDEISPHFSKQEVEASQTALRLGLSNQLPAVYVKNAQDIARFILEPCRTQFGSFTPSSWYRSKEVNQKIGGSATSQHCIAQAVDFSIKGVPNPVLGKWIAEHLNFDQLIFEFTSSKTPFEGWIHCSYRAGSNRGQILKAFRKNNKTVYESVDASKIDTI